MCARIRTSVARPFTRGVHSLNPRRVVLGVVSLWTLVDRNGVDGVGRVDARMEAPIPCRARRRVRARARPSLVVQRRADL